MSDFAELIPIDSEWLWVLKVFVVILATALVSYIVNKVLKKMASRASESANKWDDILFKSLYRPVAWIIWVVGLDIAADLIHAETGSTIFTYSDSVRDVGVLVCIAWFCLNMVREAEAEYAARDETDTTTVRALGKLTRVAIVITALLVILQTLGYSISGVLAMGGIGGIAIGFAAKDLLANFFGGLMIYLDRPFSEGDWIRSPDRQIEGTVEHIGWRITVIRNFQSQPVYVPNSVFTNIVVDNPSRMNNRRIYETIGLRYADLASMHRIVDEVRAMLVDHPEIDQEQTMMVNFNEFAGSSVDFFIYCFTKTRQWVKFHEVKQQVLLSIGDIIAANQAEIAFPTSTIHLADSISVEKS